jgi:hypothetical protein
MNRHFIDYAALPCEPLGTPIRPEPEKPRDGEWKPLRPGYESRTLAGGATEVRCTSLPTQPAKKPADPPSASAVSAPAAALAPAVDVPEGATHRKVSSGLFYRVVGDEVQVANTDHPCRGLWVASIAWAPGDLDGPGFERIQPTTPTSEPTAPTEWQSGAPPEKGWREVLPCGIYEERFAYFFGDCWSFFGTKDDRYRAEDIADGAPTHPIDTLQWRGPRLVGEAWPEPQQ